MEKVTVIGSGSKGNCYLLHLKNNQILMLECGVPFLEIQKALNFDFSNVIGCLLTHEHKDHSQSINQLINYGIKVYSSLGTIKSLNLCDNPFAIAIPKLKMRKLKNVSVFPFDVSHDCAEPYGFIVKEDNETLLFATDTYKMEYKFNGINYMMIECNYDLKSIEFISEQDTKYNKKLKRVLFSHMELETTKDIVKKHESDNLKNVILIHNSYDNLYVDEALEEIEKVTKAKVEIAKKGTEYDFQKKKRK